jgi:nucleotidyltransferase substrate binding protein (TIGR01987 family)
MDRQLLVREATSLILKHASPRRIFLYGSEASGEATSGSDIDIAFDGDVTDNMEEIESEINALPTLVRIDVKNLAFCEERFINRVKETGRVLYSADKKLRFEDGLYNYTRAFEKFDSAVKSSGKFIADGYGDIYLDLVVKRFEFTFEMSWKAIKRYLDFVGLVCKNPRSCFKEAFAQGLIDDEPLWLDMIEMRNRSSHIYNEQEIRGILDKLEWYNEGFSKLKARLERELAEA